MYGFSVESLAKLQVLNFVLPIIGQRLTATGVQPVTLIDAFAGPGRYSDPELGDYDGSPAVLYNTARLLNAPMRIVLIERDLDTYYKLVRFVSELPAATHVQLRLVHGPYQQHLARSVELAGDGPVLIFSDPCGCEIPTGLEQLVRQKNVSVLLRYSLTAAARSRRQQRLRTEMGQLRLPYWGYSPDPLLGVHKYGITLGTHDSQLVDACGRALAPAPSATAAVDWQLSWVKQPDKYAPILSDTLTMVHTPDGQRVTAKAMREAGVSKSRIARQLNLSRHAVTKLLGRMAAPQLAGGRNGRRIAFSDADLSSMAKLRSEGSTYDQIGRLFKVDGMTVSRRLAELSTAPAVPPKRKRHKRRKGGWEAASAARTIKFTDAQLTEMKEWHEQGKSYEEIAKKVGVSRPTVMRRLTGRTQAKVKRKRREYIPLSAAKRKLAARLTAEGLTLPKIAKRLKLGYHTLRRRLAESPA